MSFGQRSHGTHPDAAGRVHNDYTDASEPPAAVHGAARLGTGEIYLVTHSADHRWWYAPAMERHEVLVFKQYDSASGVARFTPHAAFDHPDAPPGAPKRAMRTSKLRCLVTYD